jgi:hypothetical protein
MKTPDKTRLLNGPYKQPVVGSDGFLVCKIRGRVRVGSWSQGPIPWPLEEQWGAYILCGDLVRAVENEPAAAVVRQWGVGEMTVTNWRKRLNVGRKNNPGTTRLRRWQARKIFSGRPKTTAFKQFMQRRMLERIRNREVPFVKPEQLWKTQEVRLLGTASDEDVARKLGRSLNSVKVKRVRLGIAAVPKQWITPQEIALLGTMPDAELAVKLGRTVKSIEYWRTKLGRTYFASKSRAWTRGELKLLGKHGDAELARRLNRTHKAVQSKRVEAGLLKKSFKKWTMEETALLGKISDSAVARQTRRSLASVQVKRRSLKIPCKE